MLLNELKSDVARLPGINQTWFAINQVVPGCKRFLQNVELLSYPLLQLSITCNNLICCIILQAWFVGGKIVQHLSLASSNLATQVAPFFWPFNRSLNSMLPAQLTPSPKYPGLQVHMKERLVSVQNASAWQLCFPFSHSSRNQEVEVTLQI